MSEYYDITPQEFLITGRRDTEEGHVEYDLRCINECDECPECGGIAIKKDGLRKKKIRDLPAFGKQVGLVITMQRYFCQECYSSFYPDILTVDGYAKMTNRMRDYICNESLRKPFVSLAEELSISDTTIKRVFQKHVDVLESERELIAPEVLGIDENHMMHKYRAVFTDVKNGLLLDILPKRSKVMLGEFLTNLPRKERVKCVTLDMWNPYRDIAYEFFPKALVVVDHFHVMQGVTKALDKIRVNLRKELPKKERVKLKNSRYLFLKNMEDLTSEEDEKLSDLFAEYRQFEEAYYLKEDFREMYRCKSKGKAQTMYASWEKKARAYPEFNDVRRYMDGWYREIFNYFEMPHTNAITEYLNGVLNRINDSGKGYSFDVLRAKALFGTTASKPAKFKYTEYRKASGGGFNPGYGRPLTGNDMMGLGSSVRTKKTIVHGEGVDIMELYSLLQDKGIMDL